MNRKKLGLISLLTIISVLVIAFVCVNVSAGAYKKTRVIQQEEDINKNLKERAKVAGIDNPQLPSKLPDNKNSDKIKTLESMKGYIKDADLKDDAKYLSKELMTYEEMLEKYSDIDYDPTYSADRMMWITVAHYPKGVQHSRGFVKNAVITKFYDAETGELIGYGLKSLDKDGMGIRRP